MLRRDILHLAQAFTNEADYQIEELKKVYTKIPVFNESEYEGKIINIVTYRRLFEESKDTMRRCSGGLLPKNMQRKMLEVNENYNKICADIIEKQENFNRAVNNYQLSFGLEGMIKNKVAEDRVAADRKAKGLPLLTKHKLDTAPPIPEPTTLEQEFALSLPITRKVSGGKKTKKKRHRYRRR